MITENSQNNLVSILKDDLHVTDPYKLKWMSQYAQIHEARQDKGYGRLLTEGLQPYANNVSQNIYATPLNTVGMGNPMAPLGVPGPDGFNANGGNGTGIGNTGADFHNPNYQTGSGDIPMSTLPMALEVAAMTIGLELVPIVPATGPWHMLTWMDTPYAGGKLGKINETSFDGKGPGSENKPIYITVNADFTFGSPSEKKFIQKYDEVVVEGEGGTLNGKFMGWNRYNADIIIKVEDCGDEETSISDVFSQEAEVTINFKGGSITSAKAKMRPDLVGSFGNHQQGFSNFFEDSEDPMTRAQNETGVGNTIGVRMFSKWIQMGSYEVTGAVTRQQLQDMPLYGVDVVGKVLEAMQNQISQEINNRILDRVRKLGVTNAVIQKKYQNVDLNLTFDSTETGYKDLTEFVGSDKFVGIDNQNKAEGWGRVKVAVDNTNYENYMTHQRRISSRILAAKNLIAVTSRRGAGNFVVTNSQVVTALQDNAQFVPCPMTNTFVQDNSKSIYFAGSYAGVNVYCDPYQLWDDTRVTVGRKGTENEPGVIFMPYILCDTIQITAEGTMAPKLLCNSRFALPDIGWAPEQSYFTFLIDGDGAAII